MTDASDPSLIGMNFLALGKPGKIRLINMEKCPALGKRPLGQVLYR
jgi:hypothetical protein